MPELPEVETIRRQLDKTLKGKRIKNVEVYTHKMVKIGPGKISNTKTGTAAGSKKFIEALKGKTIQKIERRAKYLLIHLSGRLNLMIHLRMSGQMIVVPKKDLNKGMKLSLARSAAEQVLPTKHSHAVFVFSDGNKLFYNDTRQFGHIRLVNDEEKKKVLTEQSLGPEPLETSFKVFKDLSLKFKNKRAKDFLLDQKVIAGIGNIYADESLFISKIHPQRKVSAIKEPQLKLLFTSVQKTLQKAIKLGGSSVDNFLTINGTAGKFSHEHLVYAKSGKPCPRCKRPLVAKKIGSRTATFCKHCQK